MSALTITKPSATTTLLTRNTGGYRWGSIFFLVLGALDAVALIMTGNVGHLIGPALSCLFVGVVFGFMPHRITVEIDREAGEVNRTSRSLFTGSENTEPLADFVSIWIEVQTYAYWFYARRKNGGVLSLFPEMKMWTFTRVAPPATVARAQQVADAFGLPLEPAKS